MDVHKANIEILQQFLNLDKHSLFHLLYTLEVLLFYFLYAKFFTILMTIIFLVRTLSMTIAAVALFHLSK